MVVSSIGFEGDHSLLCLIQISVVLYPAEPSLYFCSVHSLNSNSVLYRFPLLQISYFLTNFDFKTLFLQNLILHPFQCFLHCTHCLFLFFHFSLPFYCSIHFSFYTNIFIQHFEDVGEIQITSTHHMDRASGRKYGISFWNTAMFVEP